MPIQIEDIFRGLATGSYVRQLGSQFSSIWRFDGLSETEATPQEYTEFCAPSDVQLGHGLNIQRLFLIREGMGRKDDTWPNRFFEENLSEGPAQGAIVSRATIEQVLDEYYEARGWNRATGHPTPQTLDRLKLNGRLGEPTESVMK